MRLRPCSSCERPVAVGVACPFCGAAGVPTVSAPRAAAVLLSVPLLAVGCTETKSVSPPEPAYGSPAELVPNPEPSPEITAEPEKPTKADPPPPSEPQNEIYGTPEMIDERREVEEPKAPE